MRPNQSRGTTSHGLVATSRSVATRANTDAIGEFMQAGRTDTEFIDAIERCLADGFGSRAGRIDDVMRANSWDERVQRIATLVDQALAGKERDYASGSP